MMQELGRLNLKLNVGSHGLEKYMSFIDSFQFLSSSWDSLFKNLNKDDFKYLSQEYDNNVLDLVKQNGFYRYEYMSNFEKFKEELSSKPIVDLVTKNMNMLLMLRINFKWKQWKGIIICIKNVTCYY